MFTGIIERVAAIGSVTRTGTGVRLAIDLGHLAEGSVLGDSIAVSGCCLTIAAFDGSIAHFDCSTETLRKTTAGSWRPGSPVNLERALAVGDRLGGHFVSGHIDGVGRIAERRPTGDGGERFVFTLPDDGSVKVVEKGSLAVDGISLTSWDCRGRTCAVAVVPHTLAETTLADRRPGDAVNLEQDLIGRWVMAGMGSH
jgi:riboflavin synthase